MEKSDWPRFQKLWDAVYSTYNKDPQTPETKSLIFQALSGVSLKELSTALTAHIQRSRFAPTVADILTAAKGSDEDRARVAWSRALEALRAAGPYRSVDLGDEAAHYAIEQMGGWAQFGSWESDKTEWKYKAFQEHYLQALRTGLKGPRVLAGLHAIQNKAVPEAQRALVDDRVWLAVEREFGQSPALLGDKDVRSVKRLTDGIGKSDAPES